MVCPECKGEEDVLCIGCGHCYWCCGYDDGCDGGGRDRRRRGGGLMICPECRKSSVPDFICEGCLLCLACCECFGVDKEHEINPFPHYTIGNGRG